MAISHSWGPGQGDHPFLTGGLETVSQHSQVTTNCMEVLKQESRAKENKLKLEGLTSSGFLYKT